MTSKTNRYLAKGFMPVLLLSAALTLPAVSMAAPAPNGKAHAAAKADRNHNDKQKVKVQKVKVEKVKVQKQRTVVVQQRPVVVQQKRVVRQQRTVVRPVVVQRPVAVQRTVVVQRPVVVAVPVQRGARRSWDGWNRRYTKYGSTFFQLDGTFVDQQYGCVIVRDHSGQVIPLVGNPGDLRRGEHLLLAGRIENNTSCGTAFRVSNVDRVWADTGHRQVLFDRRYDGEYYDRTGGRYGRNDRDRDRDGRYDRTDRTDRDDRYDRTDRNDRDRYNRDGYDPDGRRSIILEGRLDDSGDCPVIRGDRGEYYDLVGDLNRFQDGRHVEVVGRDGLRSRCGGKAIEVTEIRYR